MIGLKVQTETRLFNRDLKRFLEKNNYSYERGIRKVALDLLANILTAPPKGRHPVDTGRARAGWYMSAQGLGYNYDFLKGLKNQSDVETGKQEGSFKSNLKSTFNKYVELINGVNYIVFLEYGSSQQAPYGMVRISMRKMRGQLASTIGKEIKTEWNKFYF